MSDTTHKSTGVHLPIHNAPVPTVCAMLRSRGGTDDQFDGVDWRHGRSMTANYWCLATMESVGPDDHYVHAHECRAGRRCFRKPSE
ncbi:MAG TPA: hypothetical protein VLI90_15045 [Tepidisphaeraceae bacterium]|nr:hypothetical protein [Tepidisphaeraceae bacterium]